MIEINKKQIVSICILLVLVSIFMISKTVLNDSHKTIIKASTEDVSGDDITLMNNVEEVDDKKEKKAIMVDVCGEVLKPGVVELLEGDRVVDAVTKAGGLLDSADRIRVNLARIVEDGEQIYIPRTGETLETIITTQGTSSTNNSTNLDGKIDINRATQSELETLSGIGEVLAERIIQYREDKGSFNKIEDIMNVSGIGTKKFEDIKSKIKVK